VNVTATAILYSLDDGSGTIDVKKYTEQNEDENMGPSIDSIQYVFNKNANVMVLERADI
jgi:hypothetical protein